MLAIDEYSRRESARAVAAQVDGQHYAAHAPSVKAMRKAGNDDEAAGLLLRLIEAIEREAAYPLPGLAVPPWYFEQLAIIYRKAGRKADAGRLMQRYAILDATASREGELLRRGLIHDAARPTSPTTRPARRTGTGKRRGSVLALVFKVLGHLLARAFRR